VTAAVLLMALISAGSYYAFGLDEVRSLLLSKIRQRLSPRTQS
jgi:hypothetical protein